MNDYRLDRLSPRLFEHVVQSLAIGAISSTVAPFGDGPDGGREATFDGQTHYGSESAHWDGRGVIQAKFHVRPQDTTRDAAWARAELRKELKQYNRRTRPRPAPDYFIYAVNVVLSPGEGQGKDLVQAILDEFRQKHKLKGVDIWDYDKLRTLLDRDEPVRTSYMAWILPSDVLAALAAKLHTEQRDYYPLILRYLQRELINDQFAKLEQAGHSADDAIPLSQVFIDLPTSRHPPSTEQPTYEESSSDRFVATVLSDAGQSFKASINNDPDSRVGPARTRSGVPGRYVLIGGPGQGKTTVGQYVCQVFRHAILADVPTNLISAEAANAMEGFSRQWGDEKLAVPRARRLPFRIVLGDLARSLAENEASSLPSYLATRFNANSSIRITDSEIERILCEYPSIIVLDGLDEVPSSTNREALMSAVSGFLVDVASGDLDVLLIATSRPQGYNDEFSPRLYAHHYLLPLPADDALKYGRQLAKTRFGHGNERYSKVADRLERALQNPATARLMETPLQVTILTLLVDRIGTPPEERWALFSAYYKLIFERETERDIDSVAVLKTNAVDVDEIHRRVGLALQVESERSGGTDARLTVDQFSEIVEGYLEEEGHQQPARAQLKSQIIEAAGNRLVFLVGLEHGQVGFEIRSLQEFMAAEGLMAGPDTVVQERLREVAASTNWRNVFLFAAGQCFAAKRHFRDTIESICVDLNEENESFGKLRVGSLLALDLLEDGPARKQPIKRRSLTRLAVQLLSFPQQEARRLALVSEEDTCDIFEEQIREVLRGDDIFARTSAWPCLAALIEIRGGRFEQLGRELLQSAPLDDSGFNSALALASGRSKWLSSVLLDYLRDEGPVLGHTFTRTFLPKSRPDQIGPWALADQPPWLAWFAQYSQSSWRIPDSDAMTSLDTSGKDFLDLRLNSVTSKGRSAALVPPPDSPTGGGWRFINAAGAFCAHPNAETLAAAVRSYDETCALAEFSQVPIWSYPWPLAECLHVAHSRSGQELAEFIESGGFGDYAEWATHEDSWREGISVEELALLPPLFTDNDGAGLLYAFPFGSATNLSTPHVRGVSQALIEAHDSSSSSPQVRQFFALVMINETMRSGRSRRSAAAPWIDRVLFTVVSAMPFIHPIFYDWVSYIDLANPVWAKLFSAVPPSFLTQHFRARDKHATAARVLKSAVEQGPAFEGLLVPLVLTLDGLDVSQRRALGRPAATSAYAGPAVQIAALMLDIVSGMSVADLSSRIEKIVRTEPQSLGPVLNAIVLRDLPYEDECQEIMQAIAITDASFKDYFGVLAHNFSRRRSRLGDPRIWSELRLPPGVLEILT